MASNHSPTMLATTTLLLVLGTACTAPQDRQSGLTRARVPILYEAYYPEQQQQLEWNPREGLQEIQKLQELTNKLLKQEKELGKLAAAAAAERTPESIYEPRRQIVEYVFSGPGPAPPLPVAPPIPARPGDDVQVASLTVSDAGQRHKVRHHHGQAEWLLRRVAPASGR